MIQRIQSVYLILIAGMMFAMLFFPISGFRVSGELVYIDVFTINSYSFIPTFVLPALIICTVILALIALFIYKKRMNQMKICIGIIVLIILICASILISYIGLKNGDAGAFPKILMAFPVVSLIVTFMAIAGIKKDEEMVRSLDRIR